MIWKEGAELNRLYILSSAKKLRSSLVKKLSCGKIDLRWVFPAIPAPNRKRGNCGGRHARCSSNGASGDVVHSWCLSTIPRISPPILTEPN
ncbi:hypothetical protein KCU90_g162, partial [Aureobasidium melanogenum]